MLIVERKQAPRNRHVGTQYTQRTLDSKEYNTRADTLSKFSNTGLDSRIMCLSGATFLLADF
jgi:hypothetical protein